METDLKQFMIALNETWQHGRYEALAEFFHPDAGMLPPGSGHPFFGADAMVESYREFGSVGKVHFFQIRECLVHIYGAIAIGLIRFESDYQIGPDRFFEKGLEQYTIDLSGTTPKVIWRAQMPLEAVDV